MNLMRKDKGITMVLTISYPTEDDIAFAKQRTRTDVAGISVVNLLNAGIVLFWLWIVYLIFGLVGSFSEADSLQRTLLFLLPIFSAFGFYGEHVFRDKHDSLSSAHEKWILQGVIFSISKRNSFVHSYMFDLENGWTVTATKDIYSRDRISIEPDAKPGDAVTVELLVAPSLKSPLNKYPRYEVVRVTMGAS